MGNQEDYEKKLKVISNIEESQIKTPHHIPVAVYIQEANTLYQYVFRKNEERFIGYGSSHIKQVKSRQPRKPVERKPA